LQDEIFYNHKAAIEFIYKYFIYVPKKETPLTIIAAVFTQHEDTIERDLLLWNNHNQFGIIPKIFKPLIDKVGESPFTKYPMYFWFEIDNDKLWYHIQVSIFKIPDRRKEFIKHLNKYGIKISDRSLDKNNTKIYSEYEPFNYSDNQYQIFQKIADLYDSAFKMHETLIKACNCFDWKTGEEIEPKINFDLKQKRQSIFESEDDQEVQQKKSFWTTLKSIFKTNKN